MSSDSVQQVTILGTGLIGASTGLALRAQGFAGTIIGWDKAEQEAKIAQHSGAIDEVAADPVAAAQASELIVLATPVLGILDWMERLAPMLQPGQLVTDVGSTKREICEHAARLFPKDKRDKRKSADFLAGHPMAGKEVQGAAHADAQLFRGAVWLFAAKHDAHAGNAATPEEQLEESRRQEWLDWVRRFGSRVVELDPVRHDELCAWASHLPQMVGTALAALLEDEFGASETLREELRDVGGRAMREMTRLGASPFSMWRDVARTNTEPLATVLLALEQRLAHIRENLKHPELREEFERANKFRKRF